MSKTVWRTRSAVGRVARPAGAASALPLSSPPTMRTRRLPLRAPRRRPLHLPHLSKRRIEVGSRGFAERWTELVAQRPSPHLAHVARRKVAKLKWSVGNADETIGL